MGGGGAELFKALLQLANFTLGPDATLNTEIHKNSVRIKAPKKGKRKVQGVPQSQTADLPRPQEEEETNKSKQAQTERTYEKH